MSVRGCTRTPETCETCGRDICGRCGRCKKLLPTRHGGSTQQCPSILCGLLRRLPVV